MTCCQFGDKLRMPAHPAAFIYHCAGHGGSFRWHRTIPHEWGQPGPGTPDRDTFALDAPALLPQTALMTENTRKPALITGASRGLGAALALALAPTHHIIAVGRTTGALEELDDKIQAAGGQATLAPMDVTDKGAMAHLCRSVHDRWGGVDIWAHTAIYGPALMPTPDLDDKGWNRAWQTNVEATRNLIPMVNALMDDTGTALFFADDRAGQKFFAGYGATKAAQVAMVKSWAAENARIGPRVIVADPKPLATVMRTRFFPGEDRSQLASAEAEARRILGDAGLI